MNVYSFLNFKEEETSKKKRRLSEKKKKCRRRLVFAVVTDIKLVAIYTCRRRPCFCFSDPFLPVSIFTVVATTTACHHTDELDGGGDNKTVVWLEGVGALVVTRLRWRRKKTIMTSRLS
ncbi:BnaC01g41410D [Brassica napus]|uniref:BnaC01g41410D protein n=1 Tax=Brassica napus TaxID=3708 RepID=A0A078ITL2_BRANA|nr:BnaC01g41410D [Brassica napus]